MKGRKLVRYILSLFAVIFTVSACGKGSVVHQSVGEVIEGNQSLQVGSSHDDKEGDLVDMNQSTSIQSEKFFGVSNTLVVYFSATNTTERVAQVIADILDADIEEIVPEVAYTSEDLAYYTGGRADQEQADESARPAIANQIENFDQYDTIILGYPIWHGQAPRIISTFLESYNFSGKRILPYCTSHSSGLGSSDRNLHELASQADWLAGKRFDGKVSNEELTSWLSEMLGDIEKMSGYMFDFKNHSVMLNSGYKMPIMGLGTYSLDDEECFNSVSALLQAGGRLIDTAYMYHNEASVGRAVRESGIDREEIFVITKLYPNQYANPQQAIEDALKRLDIGYIDMMLLHHPGTGDVQAYQAIEKAVSEGKVRSIGLSNWYVEELEEFLPQVTIKPALVQNEIHPYYQENDVIPYIQSLGIVVQGWYPFGGRGYTKELLNDETIMEIAEHHQESSAQVILRWNLQKGVVVIPGSSNPDHIKENLDLYSFELSDEEMQRINQLDRNEKHDWY